jgi:glycosyltransferase involved in cell wall biosynthesis
MAHILHLTTVHPRDDIRIFRKECLSLVDAGHRVSLVVADGKGDATVDGVSITDIGRPKGRMGRFAKTSSAFSQVRSLRPDFIHFHDPELLPVGLALRALGHRVIYDVHEDISATIRTKQWLPFGTRHAIAFVADLFERAGSATFHRIIAATPHIASRFGAKTTLVQNFPMKGELVATVKSERKPVFAYVGGVTVERGYHQMAEAIRLLSESENRADIHVAGKFVPPSLGQQVGTSVVVRGQLSRPEVAQLLSEATAGLVLFQPHPNHVFAQPNKLFEYMSAGLPVIASHFPLWREIVEGTGCGICVDPEKPADIAAAMRWMLQHRNEAEEMGKKGAAAVDKTYNWDREVPALLSVYA